MLKWSPSMSPSLYLVAIHGFTVLHTPRCNITTLMQESKTKYSQSILDIPTAESCVQPSQSHHTVSVTCTADQLRLHAAGRRSAFRRMLVGPNRSRKVARRCSCFVASCAYFTRSRLASSCATKHHTCWTQSRRARRTPARRGSIVVRLL